MQELAQCYVNQLNNFNQEHFLAFRNAFITKFNKENLVSKIVTTNKINLADNKRQKAASYGVSIATDILGMFVPSGTIGKLADDVIGSVFQGHRKKGYRKLDGISPHTTKTELLAQALANGLQLHYKQDLCLANTKRAQKRGKTTARQLIDDIEDCQTEAQEMTIKDWLSLLLSRTISFEYVSKKPKKTITEMNFAFTPEELDTLLLISSSQLLGLSADFLLKVLNNEEDLAAYKAVNSEQIAELNAEVDKIFEQVESNTSRLDEIDSTIKKYDEKLQSTGNKLKIRYTVVDQGAKVYGTVDHTTIGQLAYSGELPENPSDRDVKAQKELMNHANQLAQANNDIEADIKGVIVAKSAEVVAQAKVISKVVAYQVASVKFTERQRPGLFETLPTKQQTEAQKDTHPEEPQQGDTPNPL